MSVVDDYVESLGEDAAPQLREVLAVIRETAPMASEVISWGMPTFKINGKNAIHFAQHARHVGLYPGAEAMVEFAPKLTDYKTSKGALQLPHDRPVPVELVREIVQFQVNKLS